MKKSGIDLCHEEEMIGLFHKDVNDQFVSLRNQGSVCVMKRNQGPICHIQKYGLICLFQKSKTKKSWVNFLHYKAGTICFFKMSETILPIKKSGTHCTIKNSGTNIYH